MHELEYSVGGLILIGLFFIWLGVAAWLARRLSRRLRVRPSLRPLTSFALGAVIFFLPVADELASRPYFEWLCHRGAVLKIDASAVKGRRVRLTVEPSNERVSGTFIPIFRSHFTYRDTVSGAILVEHEVYRATGGLLSRVTGFVNSHPLTGTFYCAPRNEISMQTEYDFVLVN